MEAVIRINEYNYKEVYDMITTLAEKSDEDVIQEVVDNVSDELSSKIREYVGMVDFSYGGYVKEDFRVDIEVDVYNDYFMDDDVFDSLCDEVVKIIKKEVEKWLVKKS